MQETQETWIQSLGWEDPLEEEMAIHSSTLAWKIPGIEEPGRLQSMGSQRVGHDWVTEQKGTEQMANNVEHLFHVLIGHLYIFFWKVSTQILCPFLICLSFYYWVVCVCVLSRFSRVWLFVIPWTTACLAPLSMGFSRQEYWSGLPCPPSGNLPNPGIESMSPVSPALAGGFFTTEPLGSIPQQAKEGKSHDHINRYKSIWKHPTLIHDKNS